MPSGLDGNPNPIRSDQRDALLDEIASALCARDDRTLYVSVDGASGVGKSTFADELALHIDRLGQAVVRSTTDSFHNQRSVRVRRGFDSADGYYLDSHNLDVLRSDLLEPMRLGQPFRAAHFDEPTDTEVPQEWQQPKDGLVLVFDGLFLMRPELRDYWDFSIFLVADSRRQRNFENWSLTADPERVAFATKRYRKGWDLYLETCAPLQRVDCVIDNNEFEKPLRLG
jgi:uridine kinase